MTSKLLLTPFAFFSFLTVAGSCEARGSDNKVDKTVTYYVPVEDESLKPFANYELTVDWKLNKKNRSFEYELPVELTGANIEIALSETSPGVFEGTHAKAKCQENPQLTCVIQYYDLVMDKQVAEKAVLSKYTDSATAEGKMQIMRIFTRDSDPIGVMTFLGQK